MTHSYKNVKGSDKILPKSRDATDRELSRLKRLLNLLSVPASKALAADQLESVSRCQHGHSESWCRKQTEEQRELESFSVTYGNERRFACHPMNKHFLSMCTCLVKNRLNCRAWLDHTHPQHVLRILVCLRLLMREHLYQKVFIKLQGIGSLSQHMEAVCSVFLDGDEQVHLVQQLVNMTYIFKKLSAEEDQRQWITQSGAHKTLVRLLVTRDSSMLLGALLTLNSLAESVEHKEKLAKLSVVENLLEILQECDPLCKIVSAELLRLLCPVQRVRERLRECEGLPVLLSLLHGDQLKLLKSVLWVLVQLCQEKEARVEIRLWGALPQLLRILQIDISHHFSVESLSSSSAPGHVQKQQVSEEHSPQHALENMLSLQAACCAALTELILDDSSAHQLVQENGVYIIGKLILLHRSLNGPKSTSLQCYALRALRFLFSTERNRHLFKRLFPPELFEMFIDVGHYVRDISSYETLQTKISLFSEEELITLKENFEAVNLQKSPMKVISDFAILDHLGSGAFGSVFKVRKQGSQNLLALKEVNLHNPAFGSNKKDRESSVEKIVSELVIIKEQISHPNIVKYYKTFLENERLYIVMELINGAPLAEHFTSLREKQQCFTEDRVWTIFIQMCLALRYLHKEKRIVHRDLSPSNIMLGETDRVTITDFGLAKQKEENGKLTSVVGTILYSCPEIVKNEPYGEKADIWATGCVLYQMLTLQAPFYSNNMLSLATKIVEADYEPVEEGLYSERLTHIIKWCLNPDTELRPDVVELSAHISDMLMKFMDGLCATQQTLEKRKERDRKRVQKYHLDACRGWRGCCVPLESQGESLETSITSSTPHPHNSSSLDTSMCAQASRSGQVNRSLSSSDHASGDMTTLKAKPRSASAGICVLHNKVRQIEDPIHKLLLTLHKIIYISQLPLSLQQNSKRRVIDRFKRSLFDSRSSACSLKVELSKLLQGSPELMEISFSADLWSHVLSYVSMSSGDLREGVTYEQMSIMIEEVLEENGYYGSSKRHLIGHCQHLTIPGGVLLLEGCRTVLHLTERNDPRS